MVKAKSITELSDLVHIKILNLLINSQLYLFNHETNKSALIELVINEFYQL